MKKTLIAAIAVVAMASCTKEITEATTAPVAATFTAASITRVADNAWVANDKIGISMFETKTYNLIDSKYENVPYTVSAAGTSGTFTADGTVIYFPVDGSTVDFCAYYPQSEIDDNKNIAVSVAEQGYEHIDLVAAKVSANKTSPIVQFTGDDNAFKHQLSKLTMNIVAGDGIDALTDIVATIKGQYTTATYNIYTSAVTAVAKDEITAITSSTSAAEDTTPAKAIIEAILIPTDKIAGSTIEFAVGGNVYYLDTKEFVFTQGCEHTYTITLTRTGATISSATISDWSTGTVENSGKLEASDMLFPTMTTLDITNYNKTSNFSLTVDAENAVKVYVLYMDEEFSDVTVAQIKEYTGDATSNYICTTIEQKDFGTAMNDISWTHSSLYIYAVAENANGNLSEIMDVSETTID